MFVENKEDGMTGRFLDVVREEEIDSRKEESKYSYAMRRNYTGNLLVSCVYIHVWVHRLQGSEA